MKGEGKRIIRDALILISLSFLLGLVTHFPTFIHFFQGDYGPALLDPAKYADLVFISLEEAEAIFHEPGALFIDSRSREEFQAGHIPGALNLPLDEVRKGAIDPWEKIPPGKRMVVYCHGEDCQQSLELARFLHDQRFRPIAVLQGGFEGWLKAGFPVELGGR